MKTAFGTPPAANALAPKVLKLPLLGVILFTFFLTGLYGESTSLEDVLKKTGATMRWDSLLHMGQLSKEDQTIVFRSGSSWMVLNGDTLLPTGTIIEEQGRLVFSREATDTILGVFNAKVTTAQYRLTTILIDPGHGGRDSGAIRHWKIDGVEVPLAEKDIVLEICLQLAEKLQHRYPGKNIMLTRKDDTYPVLEKRVAMANGVELAPREGMLYLSIHANASLNAKAEGYEVWYLPQGYRRTLVDASSLGHAKTSILPIVNTLWEEEFTHESIRLADMILQGFQDQLGPDIPNRGRREESWFVVRNARMASVLVEIGFITNEYEAKRLRSPKYLKKITEAIYTGVHEFVDYFEIKGS